MIRDIDLPIMFNPSLGINEKRVTTVVMDLLDQIKVDSRDLLTQIANSWLCEISSFLNSDNEAMTKIYRIYDTIITSRVYPENYMYPTELNHDKLPYLEELIIDKLIECISRSIDSCDGTIKSIARFMSHHNITVDDVSRLLEEKVSEV